MLNNPKVRHWTYGAPTQILANVEHQMSVGCRVPASLGVEGILDNRKIVPAGTPIHVDFADTTTEVTTTSPNAVLLHDVDVTDGDTQNGTALYFGVVNINRLHSTVQSKVTAGVNTVGAVSFMKA